MLSARKILLLYITVLSGHHRAALAIERALKSLDSDTRVYTINSFHYTNPILERIINRTYTGIIKRTPEVWEYLYDNPKIVKNTQALKKMIHRYNNPKMKMLIDEIRPDVIACTQAFPCGMVSDYKATFNSTIPLVGILTDFYPHSYWLYESVDRYVVASKEAKEKLIENGVLPEKVSIYGIPIDISFRVELPPKQLSGQLNPNNNIKTILVMGGSGGFGPIRKVVLALDRIDSDIQIIVVTGTNNSLYSYLKRQRKHFKKRVTVISYADNINELMTVADMVITKPGGLTVSEALAKALPIIIVNPIPGQEAKNTQFLLQEKAALRADSEEDVAVLVDNLCATPSKLEAMKNAAASLGRPDSALDIAKMILSL